MVAAVAFGALPFAPAADARLIRVPADFPTIQQAIDAADDGDEIIVSPGTYLETIDFKGKNLDLHSTDPLDPEVVEATVIRARGSEPGIHSTVTFSGSESSDCRLAGFTITDGSGTVDNRGTFNPIIRGGGIHGHGTRATIERNIIRHNALSSGINLVPLFGAGLFDCDGPILNNVIEENSISPFVSGGEGAGLHSCDGLIQGNLIQNNEVGSGGPPNGSRFGGGLGDCQGVIRSNIIANNRAGFGGGLARCDGTVQGNLILRNTANGPDGNRGLGGGLYDCDALVVNNVVALNTASNHEGLGGGAALGAATFHNNTFYGNSAATGGGLSQVTGPILNCIIWANEAGVDAQIHASSTPDYSDIQDWTGGGDANISLDPRLLDPARDEFHLRPDSPCIDAGFTISGLLIDIDGAPRPAGLAYDIGADERLPFAAARTPWTLYGRPIRRRQR